ncbi:heat shock protein 67B1 [Calliphora vicina]|uniref:heat shock protein 67B1 n=1 Tax=Calliphora vicina TaxID=7373 RepID=UPI00325BF36D
MSLIPFILDLADELHEFSRCLANGIDINDFGFGLYTGTDQQQPQQHQQQPQQQQQQQPQTSPRRSRTSSFSSFWMPSKRHHPYNRIKTACCAKSGEEAVAVTPEKSDAGSSSIGGTPGKSASYSVVNKNGFQVSMNVKQFAPNELSVKTIDNCIVVEGRHDDKEDGHGVISRHFVRKYMLPKGYDPNDVLSTLSSDGILTVKAPPPPPPTAKNDEPNERIIEIQPTPGPTPVLVVSAKETPAKETSKKLATTPSARLECQLPEKRQKLDLPPEPEPEESAETAPAPIPPATATVTETDSASASVAVAGTEVESNDVDMEKADEQINEVVLKQTEQQQQPQQQTSDVEGPENEVEKKAEIIEQNEKEQKQKQGKIGTETEKKLLDECMSDSNGDSKIAAEKMEESSSVTEATEENTEKTNETTPAAAKVLESAEESNVTKMEVDDDGGDNDGHDDVEEKTDNTEVVVATIKTADSETKTAVKAAAGADSAKKNTDKEKTNNTDTSSSSSNTSTTTTTTNNNNNTSTNSNSTTTITNNSSTESTVTENSANDVKGGNGVVTGDIPVDIPKSTDSDAANTATAKTKASAESSKAESVAEAENDMETAVLGTDTTTTATTKNIIDDVALLKAATADPADITDNAEENVILTESMDGITTTNTTNTNTTTTTVDNVECSLFAKKSHLGNGNNTTATPLVGTEEMAN